MYNEWLRAKRPRSQPLRPGVRLRPPITNRCTQKPNQHNIPGGVSRIYHRRCFGRWFIAFYINFEPLPSRKFSRFILDQFFIYSCRIILFNVCMGKYHGLWDFQRRADDDAQDATETSRPLEQVLFDVFSSPWTQSVRSQTNNMNNPLNISVHVMILGTHLSRIFEHLLQSPVLGTVSRRG